PAFPTPSAGRGRAFGAVACRLRRGRPAARSAPASGRDRGRRVHRLPARPSALTDGACNLKDMKVGLVLGAGGVLGGAWLTGGLAALAEETGWDPASADYIVGTSAGSVMGSLVSAGVPPWFMVAHSAGETFNGLVDADGRPA